jgi:catechol-2,3-dioxygenase
MVSFYRDFLGMKVTKTSSQGTFFSSDPYGSDHEIALLKGRPDGDDPHLIQQISMRVETLADLHDFHERIQLAGYTPERVLSHASAIGCYFPDPEGNNTEVFWRTGYTSWMMVSIPIDIDRPDDEILADVRRHWEITRTVELGEPPDPATQEAVKQLLVAQRAAAG